MTAAAGDTLLQKRFYCPLLLFGPRRHMNRDRAATSGSGTLMAPNEVVGTGNYAVGTGNYAVGTHVKVTSASQAAQWRKLTLMIYISIPDIPLISYGFARKILLTGTGCHLAELPKAYAV